MSELLEIITPGEVLRQEFMEPLGISQNRLARDIDVPPSRVHAVIHGDRAITADMALRLGKYFHTSAEMWINLQSHYDLECAERETWPGVAPRIRALPLQDEYRPQA